MQLLHQKLNARFILSEQHLYLECENARFAALDRSIHEDFEGQSTLYKPNVLPDNALGCADKWCPVVPELTRRFCLGFR